VYSFLGPPPGSLLGPAVLALISVLIFDVEARPGVEEVEGSTAGPAKSSSSSNPGQRGNSDKSG